MAEGAREGRFMIINGSHGATGRKLAPGLQNSAPSESSENPS